MVKRTFNACIPAPELVRMRTSPFTVAMIIVPFGLETKPLAAFSSSINGVKYATDRVGAFTKTVTVTSNAEGQPTKILTIKGTVLPDPVKN